MHILPFSLRRLATVCVVLIGTASSADAQVSSRVVAARDSMTIRSCAQRSCDVVAQVPAGHSVEILKTDSGWYWVLVTLDGTRMMTGWVEASAVMSVPKSAVSVGSTSDAVPARRSTPLGQGVFVQSDVETAQAGEVLTPDCLTCVATRTATSDEWSQALAVTSGMKASATPAPPIVGEPPTPMPAAPARSRVDTVRRDGRTTTERMRDDVEEQFGPELTRLGELATKFDPELQAYMTVCYDKYLPVAFVASPDASTPLAPRPVRPRATLFDMWRTRPAFAWNEPWTTQLLLSAESTTFCQELWNGVATRAADLKSGVERIERAARIADIYPGVVRDALEAHGLAEKK